MKTVNNQYNMSVLHTMLRTIRERKGLTQEQAGQLLGGYSKQTINQIENGKRPVGLALLQKFGKVYGMEFKISASPT